MKNLKKVLSLALCFVFIFCFAACKKDAPVEKTTTTTKAKVEITNPLTGETGFNKEYVGKRPLAITLHNIYQCRPQWGLGSADITIETEVEGTATRFLCLYSDYTKVPVLGPHRSARIDYVKFAMGFDAILCHVGGSSGNQYGAYEVLNASGYDHLDGAGYRYAGSGKRPAGANGYNEYSYVVDSESLMKAIEAKNIRTEIDDDYKNPFTFNKKTAKYSGGTCSKLFFKCGCNKYTYEFKDGLYYANLEGQPFMNTEDQQMAVTNVILLYVNSITTVDYTGHVNADLTSGKGIIASNGTYQNITWKKGANSTDYSSMLKLYDETGKKELKLNVGKSYIGVISPSNAKVTEITA